MKRVNYILYLCIRLVSPLHFTPLFMIIGLKVCLKVRSNALSARHKQENIRVNGLDYRLKKNQQPHLFKFNHLTCILVLIITKCYL